MHLVFAACVDANRSKTSFSISKEKFVLSQATACPSLQLPRDSQNGRGSPSIAAAHIAEAEDCYRKGVGFWIFCFVEMSKEV